MRNEFDDCKLSFEEMQAILEKEQPEKNQKTADEKITEMQNKIKVIDDSLTELILDSLI